ncbi:unnamed protein product [Prorocentrum cordatum]|uniref:Protein kinase domain-containing protein n=1 Tax=Prorocentrum cordatum TaxID=2364126 RepID=A0ABN9WXL2_9DINO|nr:unnamed protein product [Polarella glacialis]
MTHARASGSGLRGGPGAFAQRCRRDETHCLKDGGTSDRTGTADAETAGAAAAEAAVDQATTAAARTSPMTARAAARSAGAAAASAATGAATSRRSARRRPPRRDHRGAGKVDRRVDKNENYKSHRDNHRNRSRSLSEEYSGGSDSRSSSSGSSGKAKSGDSNKDEIVHFSWQRGSLLDSRYRIVKLLGDGTFGRVLLAEDLRDRNRQVAVKVIRDVKRYAENAKIEADILKDIRRADPRGESTRSAIMLDHFSHNRHFCMVFQPCGASLYDFLKKNSFKGFWMQDTASCVEAAWPS